MTAGLESANAQLRAELSQLKKAERTASQERQVLESSKTVLELHVQTRTRELQKLQRRYEMILNSAGEGICGLDVEGKATFVNPAVAKITGWPISDLIGKTESEIFDAYRPKDQPVPPHQNPGERILYRKDGTCFPLEFVKTPINENSTVVGAVLVFKDITERKRVEETLAHKASELARSNAELEQFAFVASHDLQEPLRKIQAFGDRLITKCEGAIAPEARDYLQRMQSAAARMRTLINDLLTFSRVIRSSEPFVHVDLAVAAKEIIGDLEVRIEKAGARVEIGELPSIEADPMQMRQLLLNLIGNALKFQTPGSQPVVKVHSRILTTTTGDQLCKLTVQDNGIGFDEKYLDKIFAVFQRLHGRTEYEGTGVGLAICRRISDRHRGTIVARSQLGQGATFVVTLPVRQPKESGYLMNNAPKMNIILMAEDDSDDRLLVKDALAESPWQGELRFVENGEELLDYLLRRGKYGQVSTSPRPGLILLDLNMPRKDGREVLREIKSDADLRRIPVVVLTTSKADTDIEGIYGLGANSFISKPIQFESLVSVMKVLGQYWFRTVELPAPR